MRIRTAKVAIIPMWVIQHPDVQGNGTRIAVYAGLQAVAFEAADMQWRSTREIAIAVGAVIGMPGETCRKHLSALVLMGAIIKTDDEVILPQDPPGLGHDVGRQEPSAGSDATQTGDCTTTRERGKEKNTPVGAHGPIDSVDDRGFGEFWAVFPRRTGRKAAETKWRAALRRADAPTIMAGLQRRVDWWTKARTPMDKIPHATTWLSQDRWLDEIEPLPAQAAATRTQALADVDARSADEVEAAIAAGDPDLAWKLIRAKARARGEKWFDDLATQIGTLGRTFDLASKMGIKRDGRPVTIDDWQQVIAARAEVMRRARPDVSFDQPGLTP